MTETEIKALVKIAQENIPSLSGRADLEPQGSDELDFFDVSVWCLKDALIAAYEAGKAEPVRHGRWIHPKGYVVSNGFLCSECGHEATSYQPINPRPGGACMADENGNFYYPPKMNFCPRCGAKMDLED